MCERDQRGVTGLENASAQHHPWFTLQVQPRHEVAVCRTLDYKGYEHYAPTFHVRRRWSDRIKEIATPVFPGYVFCRLDVAAQAPIITTFGVIRILGVAGRAQAVPDEEIESLRRVFNIGRAVYPCDFIDVGSRVRVNSGPLIGVEGYVLGMKRHHRLVVSITILQRSVVTELDEDTTISAVAVRPRLSS